MFFPALFIAVGVVVLVALYLNRDPLDARPGWRRLLPFVVAVLLTIGSATAVYAATHSGTTTGVNQGYLTPPG
jgi:type IV secretory pathway VirB2 component (pilin)